LLYSFSGAALVLVGLKSASTGAACQRFDTISKRLFIALNVEKSPRLQE